MRTEWILIVGNAVDGHEFFGPFESNEDATWYGENHALYQTWWTVDLTPVNMEGGDDPDYGGPPNPSEIAAMDKDR